MEIVNRGKKCVPPVKKRELFKTGGGRPERPASDDLGDLLTAIIICNHHSQRPLECIPGDDHVDSSNRAPFQSSFDDHQSSETLSRDEGRSTTSAVGTREDGITIPGQRTRTKRLTIHEKLAMEFHEHKIKYLKDEHEMKMRILNAELAMKEVRKIKQQQYQCATETSTSSGSQYFEL
ncbi:hypothetical protein DPEC_G00278900 [Dallia pectoralis]|uniref:Uncharacterized protein n=1 Tax=Dallia pectoralis TaxID=75939 RepID=A0ACC2FMC0_DALPE|nr:hypothetical protein DPEC_G00278900 [Dallia pectoralis]